MKVAIGGDHAGFSLKEWLKGQLQSIDFVDVGPFSEESVDYPDFAHKVADIVVNDDTIDYGILICGTANGVAMAANKHYNIRAAICWTGEIAKFAKTHNNANIICIPARFVSNKLALNMIESYQKASFEGGRHCARVDKISITTIK